MAELYVTADAHFGHLNIIQYTERPFISLHHMNETLVENWNNTVKPDDTVYHIGDFCFKGSPIGGNGMHIGTREWEARLNGKIYHVKGNHDRDVKHMPDYIVISYGGKKILLLHNPAAPLPMKKGIDLVVCGHVHNSFHIRFDKQTRLPVYNAGVDQNDYKPIRMRAVIKKTAQWVKENKPKKKQENTDE